MKRTPRHRFGGGASPLARGASPLARRASPHRRGACRLARGFSLIEVMVALVVLSVGMIGIAAMYGHGLAAGRTAQTRTQAINLVGDMADRIRANRLGQAAYAGAAANSQCDPQSGGGVDCTPAQMAAHDVFVWQQQVAAMLPAGQGTVAFDGATLPPTYTIDVSWDEVGEGRLNHQLVLQLPTF